jgi:hypothetical protein
MDFTTVLAAVDTTTVIGGVASIAALLMGIRVAKYGFSQVVKFLPQK